MNRIFQKTLLALMISACASQSFAQDYDVSQGPISELSQNLIGGFNLIGTGVRQATSSETEALFNRTAIGGSLINNSSITVDGGGLNINGVGVAPNYDYTAPGAGQGGSVNGDIMNTGHLVLNNFNNSEGLEVGNATVSGSVINAGTISMTQAVGPNIYGSAEAIYLHGTQVAGDVLNSGTIDVHGDGGVGIIIDQHGPTPFTLGGRLINSGSINVVGNEIDGLDIEAPTSALTILNSGSISVQGTQAHGVSFWDGTLDVFKNTGQITATGGSDAHAIVLQGINFTSTLPSGSRGILNTGSISAQGDAIVVTPDAPNTVFEINQQAGSISSTSGAAIQGGGLAILNWTEGNILGDLVNMAGVNVQGSAGFFGSIIGSNVSVGNGGSLNLSTAGTAITGNLDVASQSGIGMLLSDATVHTTPYLTVGGTASFANGSHITLGANPGDFHPTAQGVNYELVSAASVQNSGLSVSSASALLNVASYTVDANSVNAVVTLKSDQQVSSELNGTGVDQPTQGLVNTFKNDVIGKLNANDLVYKSFANASTPEQLAKLGKQLAPEVSRGGVDAAVAGQSATSSALSSRMDGMRSNGLSSGDVLVNTGVWVQALNGNMDQDSRGGVAGYSANASGLAVGADGKINPDTTVGVAYSYVNANVTSDTGNKTDVQGNALSLYGAWDLGNWFTQGNLSYGHNNNDSKRYVAGTLAKGSFDSNVFSVNTLAGYDFKVNDKVLIEPRVGARYSNVQVDGYTEHDSSAALHNSAERFETGEVGAGLRIAGNAPVFGGTFQPEATLMAYHDLIGDRINQTSAFAQGGSSFAVTGAKDARDTYEGSVGVSYSINALTVGASYNYQAKSGYDADTVLFKARYNF